MAEYVCTIRWNRGDAKFSDNKYSRVHEWEFDGGITVRASSSPHAVPLPYSSHEAVDPEEAYVAAIASCHMLTFLWLAAKQGLVVDSYSDRAVGTMRKNDAGRIAVTRVVLRPDIVFSGETPSRQTLEELHHRSHEECFIANSVKTDIVVEIA